jgi:hypothetical protein
VQAPTFLLSSDYEPLPGPLQRHGQPNAVDRDPSLPGEVLQQVALGTGQCRTARSPPEDHPSDGLSLVGEQQFGGVRGRSTVCGHASEPVTVREVHRDVGQP